MAPFRSFVRRGKPRLLRTVLITESPVVTGLSWVQAGSFPYYRRSRITPFSGSFRLLGAGYCRLGASFLALPAGSGTFMLYYYSGGLFRVHNVEALSPWLCQGELGLSNTPGSEKTLSLSKPPHV